MHIFVQFAGRRAFKVAKDRQDCVVPSKYFMATEPDISLDLFDFGDDEHFPCFLTVRQDDEEGLLVSSDDDLAARLQFQEVLMDSLNNLDKSRTMPSPSSSSSSSVMANRILFPPYLTDQPSLYVKGGDPYERFCGICLEKKKDHQLMDDESCVQAICLACRKTIELSKEELYSEELLSRPKPFTGGSSAKPQTQRDFQEQLVREAPVLSRMEKDSLNAMKDQEEDGHECTHQSTKGPSNVQDTSQPMKNKGKEKESF